MAAEKKSVQNLQTAVTADAPSNEKIVQVNKSGLCYQTYGSRVDSAVLLLAGGSSSILVYEEQFCRRVADGHVIRYDLRDTGRWVTCEAGTQQYTLHDLAGDALQLLDSLRVTKSNLVGFSGGVGQPIAIEHPERVDSVALISPSPAPA
jgi:pimeloyl-ACP methyl ester carboxylesterase